MKREPQGLFCFLQASLIYSQLFLPISVDPVGGPAVELVVNADIVAITGSM